ncbi:MAG: hypothetical protein QNJ53_13695 [Pleurocapsa sp. MO_192.B19]|nr:hypothetical protein [Pleurocapsa sp. MO_192.B19]
MKNYHSDFSSKPKFTRYYGFNDFPEAMFLIEAECFDDTPVEPKTHTESSKKGIIFALGVIATLGFICTIVVLSVFQLYRFLEITPASPKITKLIFI